MSPYDVEGQVGLRKILDYLVERSGFRLELYNLQGIFLRLSHRLTDLDIEYPDTYIDMLDSSPEELLRCSSYLASHVTQFFRDPYEWHLLNTKILPYLLSEGLPRSFLSAGGSYGQELYSLIFRISEYQATAKLKTNHQFTGIDLDARAVERARLAYYLSEEMPDLDRHGLRQFLDAGEQVFQVKKRYRRQARFEQADLFSLDSERKFDLISCRYVFYHLNQEGGRQLLDRMVACLTPGGILWVEPVANDMSIHPLLERFSSEAVHFYRRVDP